MAHSDIARSTETLTLEESVRRGRLTVTLTGELVITTAPLLDEEIARVCVYGPEELLLDTRAVSFIDSTGFRAIVKALACCERNGVVLLLTRSPPHVQRLLVLTGLDRRLQFIDPGDDAEPPSGQPGDVT